MKRKIVYNGKTECSFDSCSNPSLLKLGGIYTIRYEIPKGDGLFFYAIDEVNGFFFSEWFDDLSEIETCFAISKHIPEEGKCFECTRLIREHGSARHSNAHVVFKVHTVELIGKDTYRVMTHGKIFVVAVLA